MTLLCYLLAAFGILAFLWCLAGLLLFSVADRGSLTVWTVRGDEPRLEYRLRFYDWLRQTGLAASELLILDAGMTPQARAVAERFAWVRVASGENDFLKVVAQWSRSRN